MPELAAGATLALSGEGSVEFTSAFRELSYASLGPLSRYVRRRGVLQLLPRLASEPRPGTEVSVERYPAAGSGRFHADVPFGTLLLRFNRRRP